MMQNKTQSILLDLLPRLRRDYIDNRPEVLLYRRDFEERYRAFRQAHRHNPSLLRAAGDLLDYQSG